MANSKKHNNEIDLSNDSDHLDGDNNHNCLSDGKSDKSKIDTNKNREAIMNQLNSSGMTPSIITTINNTSPSPQNFDNQASLIDQISKDNNINSNNNNNSTTSRRKKSVPQSYYESYIEDSFVGHWEREDDDPEEGNNYQEQGADDDSDSILHSSTIEFDFDSFGPESIIYAPSVNKGLNSTSINKQSQQTIVSENTAGDVNTRANSTSVCQRPANSSAVKNNDAFIEKEEEKEEMKLSSQDLSIKQDVGNGRDGVSGDVRQNKDDSQREIVFENMVDKSSATRKPILPSQIIDSPVDEAQIDLKVIEPYRRVISHAGYCHFMDPTNPSFKPDTSEPAPAVIVFSACYLPDRSRRDYDYVMDHLFLYVLSSLHGLIADDYILIFFHNTQPSTATSSNVQANATTSSYQPVCNNNLPNFTWIKRCYQLIGRKLRKNLRVLYLVKPTFWLKTIVIMCKPFISSKFSKKINFIEDMEGLKKCLPIDKLILPASADNL